MPKHRLYIVEGLPCSGKSTTASFLAELLAARCEICHVDEGSGDHPADYEFHALAPAGLVSEESKIVSLSQYTGELFDRLLQYKIYDRLPWEVESPLMLKKWQQFVRDTRKDTVYIFNCVLLQNPMCETMMRFGFPEETSRSYIESVAAIIAPMEPVVIYLKNSDIAASVQKAAAERPGWLEGVTDYHVNGSYGKSIGAAGFAGYIACLAERQERELRILSRLPCKRLILEEPQRDWAQAQQIIGEFVEALEQ